MNTRLRGKNASTSFDEEPVDSKEYIVKSITFEEFLRSVFALSETDKASGIHVGQRHVMVHDSELETGKSDT